MPFLKAGLIKQKLEEERVLSEIPTIKRKSDNEGTLLLEISDPQEENMRIKTSRDKGTEYELYVGSLYKKKGYYVEYNGINKGSRDGGIDLICHRGRYTEVVQCKCYSSHSISRNEILQFYGATKYYAARHMQEVVSCSFWTTVEVTDDTEVFEIAMLLGVKLYSGCKMPDNLKEVKR